MPSGIVFLPSYHEAIRELPDSDRLKMYDAIVNYGLYGEVMELSPVLRAMFSLIKPNIDSSQNRYKAAKENGSKESKEGSNPRGRPPKNQTKNQRENQTKNQRENQTENQSINQDKDKDFDSDFDKDGESLRDRETAIDRRKMEQIQLITAGQGLRPLSAEDREYWRNGQYG